MAKAVVFFLSFFIVVLITPYIKALAVSLKFYDYPNERKIHSSPIPYLGGVALFFGIITPLLLFFPFDMKLAGIIAGAFIFLCLGMIDDIIPVSAWIKLAVQIVVAVIVYYCGIRIGFISHPSGNSIVYLTHMSLPLTVLWIVLIINMVNLMDGLDGLAAGICAISAMALTVVAVHTGQTLAAIATLAISGSCAGFLRHNFFPAKIFMGDAGSMLLGFMLAVASIIGVLKSAVTIQLAIPFVILGIPFMDIIFAVLRRLRNGSGIFKPDRLHFHHRLLDLGFTQRQAVVLMYGLCAVLGGLAVGISLVSQAVSLWIGGAVGVLVMFLFLFLSRYSSSFVSILRLFL